MPRHIPPQTYAYLTAALWSSLQEDGTPYDHDFSPSDFDAPSIALATADLAAFTLRAQPYLSNADPSQTAHNFWLSRNGHGAGFFDRPSIYGPNCDALQSIARSFGTSDILPNGDGTLTLYQS